MTLNCKVGDLAIVVRSRAGNEGKIVRCLALHPAGTDGRSIEYGPMWRIDGKKIRGLSASGKLLDMREYCADSSLRPIRPLDEPETITTDDEVTA